jgi:hypothetical protein
MTPIAMSGGPAAGFSETHRGGARSVGLPPGPQAQGAGQGGPAGGSRLSVFSVAAALGEPKYLSNRHSLTGC